MTWHLPQVQHKIFERNPLVAVTAELRFHPILKIVDRAPDFQEGVRSRFPAYAEGIVKIFNFVTTGPTPRLESREERQFRFRTEDGVSELTLGANSLKLETRRHTERDRFLEDMKLAVEVLLAVFPSVAPVRLGLRYLNLIDRDQISKDLGRQVDWLDLVHPDFLAIPRGLSDLEGTLFANEITSPAPDGGGLTLRYGLLREPKDDDRVRFRLDIDRYIENMFDPRRVVPVLLGFSHDIFAAFTTAVGNELSSWLNTPRAV